jgi:hypothetical protein
MPVPIAAVAGIAVLGALLGGNKGGLQTFHQNRMDRMHNRAEVRAHRMGRPGPYAVIRHEPQQPVRSITYHP